MLPLSNAAQRWLLEVARQSVEAAGLGKEFQTPLPPPELSESDRGELERPAAVFVSLHVAGRLRGCIGHVASDLPLRCGVAEMAWAAAREDSRFDPVAPEELAAIEVEISVLSAPFPIQPEEVVIGRHGLLIRWGWHRGVLLPQVATEYQWDAERFLRELCAKAGLPPRAWTRGAKLEAFTADIIAEGQNGE